jgi:hypothetical protein
MPATRKDIRGTKRNQRARLLAPLIEARGGWVGLPTILALGIAQYNTRFYELRRLGFQIENRKQRGSDGVVHSYFRLLPHHSSKLVADEKMPPTASCFSGGDEKKDRGFDFSVTPSLFPDLLERFRDDG